MYSVSGIVLIALLLAGILIIAPGVPGTEAQATTPAGTFTPLPPLDPTPIENTVMVASLPFADTFDTNGGWMPDGLWTFDEEGGYDGGGWVLDGSPRSQISTLVYTARLNLSGELGAQLAIRQQGSLPTTDLITFEITLNSGLSWIVVDQQIGIDTEWELHVVDLADFKGQVVGLRLRVSTGMQMVEGEEVTGSYQIDNLSIQYFRLIDPVDEMVRYDNGRTLMGLHLIVGAPRQPVIDLVTRLRASGRPLGTIKGTTGTESILNEVAAISPETIIVYRPILTHNTGCPNPVNPPEYEAQAWMNGFAEAWGQVSADFYEIINECTPQVPVDWLVAFSIEAMRIGSQQGRCLLLFSFATGNPEPYEYERLLPAYEYALQHPCQPGRYHGIALHAYGVGPNSRLVSESGIYLGLRHRLYYHWLLEQLPQAVNIPVFLTEVGQGGDTLMGCGDIARDVIQYTEQLEHDSYILGFHLWNLGGQIGWINIEPCLPTIGDALLGYYAGR